MSRCLFLLSCPSVMKSILLPCTTMLTLLSVTRPSTPLHIPIPDYELCIITASILLTPLIPPSLRQVHDWHITASSVSVYEAYCSYRIYHSTYTSTSHLEMRMLGLNMGTAILYSIRKELHLCLKWNTSHPISTWGKISKLNSRLIYCRHSGSHINTTISNTLHIDNN
jgi:hypothetical protein